jgi:hypothetical protein
MFLHEELSCCATNNTKPGVPCYVQNLRGVTDQLLLESGGDNKEKLKMMESKDLILEVHHRVLEINLLLELVVQAVKDQILQLLVLTVRLNVP